MSSLPDYNKITFPHYDPIPWDNILPDSDKYTINFVKKFIEYNDNKRTTAKEVSFFFTYLIKHNFALFKALLNPYFYTKPLECSLAEMPKPNEIKDTTTLYNSDPSLEDLNKLLNK